MTVVAPPLERPTVASLFRAGAITVIVASIATVVAAATLGTVLDVGAFQPLQPGAVAFFTAFQVGLGMVVLGVIARRAARPRRTWIIVALVALALSFLPDLGLLANGQTSQFAGVTTTSVGALMVLHLVAAVIAIPLPLRLADIRDPA